MLSWNCWFLVPVLLRHSPRITDQTGLNGSLWESESYEMDSILNDPDSPAQPAGVDTAGCYINVYIWWLRTFRLSSPSSRPSSLASLPAAAPHQDLAVCTTLAPASCTHSQSLRDYLCWASLAGGRSLRRKATHWKRRALTSRRSP